MISYPIYKLIHLFGIFLMFASLAGLAVYTANGGTKANNVLRKHSAIAHGVSMFLILLGGFGMLARLGITHFPWPVWVYLKFAIWILFGGMVALVARKPTIAKVMWLLMPFLGVLAAYIAIMKPF
jgi:hypothetical protein